MKLAEAYGLTGCRVSSVQAFETTFRNALASDTASVIECSILMDEMVRPMVGGGSDITNFMLL